MIQPKGAFTPSAERVYASVLRTIQKELTRTAREGMADEVLLAEALATLMRLSAFFAFKVIYRAERDPTSEAALTRVHRMQVALVDALSRIIESERGAPEKGHA